MKLVTNVIYGATAYCTRIYDVEDILTKEEKELLKKYSNGEHSDFTQEEFEKCDEIMSKVLDANIDFEEYEEDVYFDDLLDETIDSIEE